MRSEKTFFSGLALLSALVSIYFCAAACKQVFYYSCLEQTAAAPVERYDIEEVSESSYCLTAHYFFEAEGGAYFGKTLFKQYTYPNLPTAILEMKQLAADHPAWTVYYQGGFPAKSTLEKLFPTNLVLRAIVSVLICFYFSLMFYKNKFKLVKIKEVANNLEQ